MVSLTKPDLVELLGPDGKLDSLLAKSIAVLVALGLADSQIAKILGTSDSRVEVVKGMADVSSAVLDIQVALSVTPEQRIANAVNTALDKKMKLMLTSDDEKLVDKIANDFLDRHWGKPTQMIQSVGVTISTTTDQKSLDKKLEAVNTRLQQLKDQRSKLTNARPLIDVTPNGNS